MDKVIATAAEAVADIPDGATIASGGFGICGIPAVLIDALVERGVNELEVFSNNCGIDGAGLGKLLEHKQIRRIVASYVGENKEFERQYLTGELELELTPQGTLAERLRAAGVGMPAFYTVTGMGTQVAAGGMPWRYGEDGSVRIASPPKPTAELDGRTYLLERALPADFAIVRAWKGDRHGNLVFRKAARNFNPVCAMAGRVAIAEVEHVVEPGDLDPDAIHLPGVYIDRVVPLTPEQARDRGVERLTTRPRPGAESPWP
ncbi:MAG: Succinyl-CoA:3-ketoacid-coenzyme transferase subunit [Actinomycetia bacterium]|nr:Succinyl-CoA:3-ketoacid-coenzyme transferase subunit [Actinomycetes bacterium]